MKISLEPAVVERIDDLVGALDRQAKANERLAAAIERRNELAEVINATFDVALNGPRG